MTDNALDDIIFTVIDLTEEERKEVYLSVAELVKTEYKNQGVCENYESGI
jgi:hypothetical protein